MVPYLKKFDNLLLVLGYSLSLCLVPLFISSELSLSLISKFSLSFSSFSSLSDWLIVVGMDFDWVASCYGDGGLLIGPWVAMDMVDH